MDSEQGHSFKLMAAAGLAFCGVIILAVGMATAGMPLERPVCLTLAPSPNTTLLAQMAPRVGAPGVRAMRVLTN